MKPFKIEFNDESQWVYAQKINSVLWYHIDGKTYSFEPQQKGVPGQGSEGLKKPEILAPMPGKILKVNCQIGDKVQVGFVAIVMEAMKMEYSLEIAMDGQIEHLNCKVGDQVAQGQLLLKVKVEEK